MGHLETIVRLFVRKEKRERILSLAGSAKRRADFRDALLHDARSLERDAMRPLTSDLDATGVAKALAAIVKGTRAYVISDVLDTKGELDDREEDLSTALALVVGKERDALVFVLAPNARTQAAYYENHEGERFLLVTTPPPAP
jgi:hypothetical protein